MYVVSYYIVFAMKMNKWSIANDSDISSLFYIAMPVPTIYRSFVSYRIRLSQVFSYIVQLRQKGSRQSCVTL